MPARGAIAQLGERLDRTQEVGGSSPPSSIREGPANQALFCRYPPPPRSDDVPRRRLCPLVPNQSRGEDGPGLHSHACLRSASVCVDGERALGAAMADLAHHYGDRPLPRPSGSRTCAAASGTSPPLDRSLPIFPKLLVGSFDRGSEDSGSRACSDLCEFLPVSRTVVVGIGVARVAFHAFKLVEDVECENGHDAHRLGF